MFESPLVIEITVNDVTDLGYGISEYNSKKVFIKDALKNEVLLVKIIEEFSTYYNAEIVSFIRKSPSRVEPNCLLSKYCGSCQFQHLQYGKQLELKNNRLLKCLNHNSVFNIENINPCIGVDNCSARYRNKAIYYVREIDGVFSIGFFGSKSHKLVNIIDCLMEPSFIRDVNKTIVDWAISNNIRAYNEKNHQGLIRNIIYREGNVTNERMIVIVIAKKVNSNFWDSLLNKLQDFNFSSVHINYNPTENNDILSNDDVCIYGNSYINTILNGLHFKLLPRSFFQLNSSQCEKLYKIVKDFAFLSNDYIVFDLYCGIGTISLFLAKYVKFVYGIEIVDDAIVNAKENAHLNNIQNVEFILGKSEDKCKYLYESGIVADIVVVDPPRKGCDKSLLDTIILMNVEQVVYVSCEPKSLFRDLAYLKNNYVIKQISTVDMFPNTSHVETVVLLSREK